MIKFIKKLQFIFKPRYWIKSHSCRPLAVCYNTNNGSLVANGETQLYSADDAGERKAIVYAKNDGTLELKNDNSTLTLQANGDVVISKNAAIQGDLNVAGNVNVDGDIVVSGISFLNHTHSYND